jgi:hypothetical protein
LALALLAGCSEAALEPSPPLTPPSLARASVANLYVADFVGTAATGLAMNDAEDVVGTSYTDPSCGPFCLPLLETVVWRGGTRIVLPTVPGLPASTCEASTPKDGWPGSRVSPGTTTHAVVWLPTGGDLSGWDQRRR